MSYNRSRLEILNYVIGFCTYKCFGENSFSITESQWAFHGRHFEEQRPPIGSLVKLDSMRQATKYYMGWLLEIKEGGDRYIVPESIQNFSFISNQTCERRTTPKKVPRGH